MENIVLFFEVIRELLGDLLRFLLLHHVYLIIAAYLGIIPAMIAYKKSRSFVGWWLFGTLLFIIALPAILLASEKYVKECPECAEMVKERAKKCRFCGHDFVIKLKQIEND